MLQNSEDSSRLQLIFTSPDAADPGLLYNNGPLLFPALSASGNLYFLDLLEWVVLGTGRLTIARAIKQS